MILSIVGAALWILLFFVIISQVLLYFQYKHPIFLPLYFIFIGIIGAVFFLFRVGKIAKGLAIISPSSGKIIDIVKNNHEGKKELILLIKSGLFHEWSHVSPITGVIKYLRYFQDPHLKFHSLILKIHHINPKNKTLEIHTLNFIIKQSINKFLCPFKYNLFEGQPVSKGEILCVATVNYIKWQIESHKNEYSIPIGIKIERGQYIPLTIDNKPKHLQ